MATIIEAERQRVQQVEEGGKLTADRFGALHPDPLALEARDRAEYGDAVVAVRVERASRGSRGDAADDEAVRRRSDAGAERAQAADDGLDAIGLLSRSSAAPETTDSAAQAAASAKSGTSSTMPRHVPRGRSRRRRASPA